MVLNIRDLAASLQKKGLIRDPIAFFILVKTLGLEGKIQAGDFRLSASSNPQQIAENLTHGSIDIWVTFPEGLRSEEMAQILQNKFSSYRYSWLQQLKNQEGYLFPDTYLFPQDVSIDTLMSILKNNFEKKYLQIQTGSSSTFSQQNAVILASIVQREGKSANEMKMIASVLENRLKIGMALQTDATIQYARGYQPDTKTWWKKDLSLQDLKINSLYNTYTNPGLPPGPISNPGLDALTAVFNPIESSYLYYFTDPSGVTHFAKTLNEQSANIARYTK
jgi:UPF0755 protein